ncbi:helix-turn-helix transcriptional regulator [Microbacterium sp. GXF7504]
MSERPHPFPAAEEILVAWARRDEAGMLSLIERNPLQVWYGLGPDRLDAILADVPDAEQRRSSVVALITRIRELPGSVRAGSTPQYEPSELATQAAYIIGTRWRGRPAAAARLIDRWRPTQAQHAQRFLASPGGASFAALQTGITMMGAGRFGEALTAFSEAVRMRPPEYLWIVPRDAYVKSAIVHALYGDPRIARAHLRTAETLPRTASWLEPAIDAHAEIAAAVVDEPDPETAIARLEAVPAPRIGELWPFWLEALSRAHLRAGRGDDGIRRVSELRAATLAGSAGDGYPAAVLPMLRSIHRLSNGDLGQARRELAGIDDHQIMANVCRAYIAVGEDDLDTAVRMLVGEQAHTGTLARVDASRRLILAWALLRRGATADAAAHLRALHEQWRQPSCNGLQMVPQELDAFAAANVDGWRPHPTAFAPPRAGAAPHFSARELDVLRLLASDRTREQIAADLFVSVNTVKTQIAAVYRKLGVSSRVDALLIAHDLGLLTPIS